MKYHYIYKITRINNASYYIGRHSTKNLEDGYFGSGKLITALVEMLGKDAFIKDILEFLPDYETLKEREREIVNEELLMDPLCLNKQLGGFGGGGWWHKEQQTKCSIAGGKASFKKMYKILSFDERSKRAKKAVLTRKYRGVKAAFTGKIHCSETFKKWKNTYACIEHQQGEKNSQFGKMWIYNKETYQSIKIQKDELIPNGWAKGRKIKKNLTDN